MIRPSLLSPALLRPALRALALVLPLGACQAAEETAPPPPVRPVLYRVVKPVAAQVFGPFAGVVAPRYQSEIGFQIAGPAFSEAGILDAAYALEQAIGFEGVPVGS